MKKIPRWLQEVSLFCQIQQDAGVDTMCSLLTSFVAGNFENQEWDEAIKNTWFVVKGQDIVFQGKNQWECIDAEIEGGEMFPARVLIREVVSGERTLRVRPCPV